MKKNIKTLLSLSFLFSHAILSAQLNPQSISIQSSLKLAQSYMVSGEYQEAAILFEKVIPKLIASKEYEKASDGMVDLSYIYYWLGEIDRAIETASTAKSILEKEVGVKNELYGICLINLSGYHYEKRSFQKSLKYDRMAINILENYSNNKNTLAIQLNNYGLTLDVTGEYPLATKAISHALKIRRNIHGNWDSSVVESIYSLGLVSMHSGNLSKALDYFLEGEQLLVDMRQKKLPLDTTLQIQVLQKLADCYLKLGQQRKSQNFINKVLRLQSSDESYRKYLVFETMSGIGTSRNRIEASKNAIRLARLAFKNFDKHPVIARQFTNLGELYQANDQLDSAVLNFHNAILQLAIGFEGKNIHSSPNIESCFIEYKLIRTLRGKAKVLLTRYKEQGDVRDLKASLDTYQLTHDFIKKLKEDITTMGSKQRLAGDALEIYEEAIETALALHKATGEEQYLEKALFFAESNKAILLLESMNERIAQSVSGIPDSLLEKERQFRVDVAYYEREINDENNKNGGELDEEKIKQWGDKLYTLRREYQQLIDQFEKEYPKYYRLKHDTKLATVQDIRKGMINRKTAFLEYFVGTQKVYLFEITKGNFRVHQLEKSEDFEENIREIQRMARKPQLSTEEVPDFQERIYLIYRQYLAEAVEHLPSKINRLLVVPDDLLNLIPFELLSRSEGAPDFLINDYTIGYTYSASLFKAGQRPDGAVADRLFLGYAPAFSAPIAENRSCTGDQLANLENSDREVLGIQALLGGNVMLGTDANRDSFLAQAGRYRIIHLATHACMDEENPMQSKVFFADDPIVNQDLFNLNLSADLAVLSACNTGSGQLVKGDGVLSLSKGFVHAGCPSAVMSLWSVDDFSTSEIMIDFYDYLKKGYTKDEALRKAKLDFIASADKVKKHPFFWAAFVQMGDPVALDLGQARMPWKLLIVISTLAVIGGYIIRRRSLAA